MIFGKEGEELERARIENVPIYAAELQKQIDEHNARNYASYTPPYNNNVSPTFGGNGIASLIYKKPNKQEPYSSRVPQQSQEPYSARPPQQAQEPYSARPSNSPPDMPRFNLGAALQKQNSNGINNNNEMLNNLDDISEAQSNNNQIQMPSLQSLSNAQNIQSVQSAHNAQNIQNLQYSVDKILSIELPMRIKPCQDSIQTLKSQLDQYATRNNENLHSFRDKVAELSYEITSVKQHSQENSEKIRTASTELTTSVNRIKESVDISTTRITQFETRLTAIDDTVRTLASRQTQFEQLVTDQFKQLQAKMEQLSNISRKNASETKNNTAQIENLAKQTADTFAQSNSALKNATAALNSAISSLADSTRESFSVQKADFDSKVQGLIQQVDTVSQNNAGLSQSFTNFQSEVVQTFSTYRQVIDENMKTMETSMAEEIKNRKENDDKITEILSSQFSAVNDQISNCVKNDHALSQKIEQLAAAVEIQLKDLDNKFTEEGKRTHDSLHAHQSEIIGLKSAQTSTKTLLDQTITETKEQFNDLKPVKPQLAQLQVQTNQMEQALTQVQINLMQNIQDVAKNLGELSLKHDSLTTQHSELVNLHEALTQQHQELSQKNDVLTDRHNELSTSHVDSVKQLQDLQQTYQTFVRSYQETYSKVTESLQVISDESRNKISQISKKVDQYQSEYNNNIQLRFDNLRAQLNDVIKQVSDRSQTMIMKIEDNAAKAIDELSKRLMALEINSQSVQNFLNALAQPLPDGQMPKVPPKPQIIQSSSTKQKERKRIRENNSDVGNLPVVSQDDYIPPSKVKSVVPKQPPLLELSMGMESEEFPTKPEKNPENPESDASKKPQPPEDETGSRRRRIKKSTQNNE